MYFLKALCSTLLILQSSPVPLFPYTHTWLPLFCPYVPKTCPPPPRGQKGHQKPYQATPLSGPSLPSPLARPPRLGWVVLMKNTTKTITKTISIYAHYIEIGRSPKWVDKSSLRQRGGTYNISETLKPPPRSVVV